MSREEAIEIIYQYSVQDMTYPKEDIEAFELAIKALEQQNPNSIRINFVGKEEAKEFNEYLKNQQESVLDKIRAEIADYDSIWVAYGITDKTKTDKGIEELVTDVLSEAKRQVLDIIDKHRVESEDEK